MENQKELNPIIKSKDIKETKDLKFTTKENTKKEMELIIAYSQVAFHTLQYSGTDITPKTIKEEIKMFYNKFGNDSVKKISKYYYEREKGEKNKMIKTIIFFMQKICDMKFNQILEGKE